MPTYISILMRTKNLKPDYSPIDRLLKRVRYTVGLLDRGSDKPRVRYTEGPIDWGSDRLMIKKRRNSIYRTLFNNRSIRPSVYRTLSNNRSIGPSVYRTLSIIGLSDPRSIEPFSIIGLLDPLSIGPSVYRDSKKKLQERIGSGNLLWIKSSPL